MHTLNIQEFLDGLAASTSWEKFRFFPLHGAFTWKDKRLRLERAAVEIAYNISSVDECDLSIVNCAFYSPTNKTFLPVSTVRFFNVVFYPESMPIHVQRGYSYPKFMSAEIPVNLWEKPS